MSGNAFISPGGTRSVAAAGATLIPGGHTIRTSYTDGSARKFRTSSRASARPPALTDTLYGCTRTQYGSNQMR